MKNIKRFVLLITCSLFGLLGCAKQKDSLSIVDSSHIDNHPAFTEYEKLERIVGAQELLTEEDTETGTCFSSRAEFINYIQLVNNPNHELDEFADKIKDEDFANKKLIFTKQFLLRDSGESLNFEKMYLDDNNLNVILNLKGSGGGWMVVSYAVYTFFIDKDLSYNSVITILNNQTGIDYRL